MVLVLQHWFTAKAVQLTDVYILCTHSALLLSASVAVLLDEKHGDVCLAQNFGPALRVGRESWKHLWADSLLQCTTSSEMEASFWVAEAKIRKRGSRKTCCLGPSSNTSGMEWGVGILSDRVKRGKE